MKYLIGLALLLLPLSPAQAFEAKGEISSGRFNVRFDDTWVLGARVNVSRRQDGKSWVGRVRGELVDFDVLPDRLVGVGVNLAYWHEDGWLLIEGTFLGRPVRVYWPTDRSWQDGWGAVTLAGEAASPNPPMPQFILALLGAL